MACSPFARAYAMPRGIEAQLGWVVLGSNVIVRESKHSIAVINCLGCSCDRRLVFHPWPCEMRSQNKGRWRIHTRR
jgi:hypothetical protein